MTGEEIGREMFNTLSAQYSVSSDILVGEMNDRAACNTVTLHIVKIALPSVVDVGCFSHMLDLLGDKLSITIIFHSLDRSPVFHGDVPCDPVARVMG